MSQFLTIGGGILVVAAVLYYFLKYRTKDNKGESNFSATKDLTALAKQGKIEKVIGMDQVIERVLHVLARKQKNNPILIGEPGVGKTAVVEGLAQRIVNGDIPEAFRDKRVLVMNLAELLSGTRYRGDLEGRLRKMLDELEKDSRRNILFIDEIHMIEQARGSEGSLDIADILKPALSRGDLHIIGATTWREYQEYIKPDAALERRFQPVLVEEPSRDIAIQILEGVKDEYEKFHGVCIPSETLEAAVDASIQFIKDRFLPDKAFDVIDEACAKVSLDASKPGQAAYLGLIHEASKHAKHTCPEGQPEVTPQDVNLIASQWLQHRTKPQMEKAG